MSEVTGPIVATALVLCAVFVPTAFISGLTGQFYKQFALTIAISTVISAFNSLTLSPALSAVLLKAHDAPPDRFTRVPQRGARLVLPPVQPLVRPRLARLRARASARVLRAGSIVLARVRRPDCAHRARLRTHADRLRARAGQAVPRRLRAVARRPRRSIAPRPSSAAWAAIALKQPGVESAVAFPGLNINGFTDARTPASCS